MTTKEFNETLDMCKYTHNGPIVAGLDDRELLKNRAREIMDRDLLFAIRLLIVAMYLENR